MWTNGEFIALTFSPKMLIDVVIYTKNHFIHNTKWFSSGFMCNENDLPLLVNLHFFWIIQWSTSHLHFNWIRKNSSLKCPNDRLSTEKFSMRMKYMRAHFYINRHIKSAQTTTKHQKWIHYPMDIWREEWRLSRNSYKKNHRQTASVSMAYKPKKSTWSSSKNHSVIRWKAILRFSIVELSRNLQMKISETRKAKCVSDFFSLCFLFKCKWMTEFFLNTSCGY